MPKQARVELGTSPRWNASPHFQSWRGARTICTAALHPGRLRLQTLIRMAPVCQPSHRARLDVPPWPAAKLVKSSQLNCESKPCISFQNSPWVPMLSRSCWQFHSLAW